MGNQVLGGLLGLVSVAMFVFALMSPMYGTKRTILAMWVITTAFTLISTYFLVTPDDTPIVENI